MAITWGDKKTAKRSDGVELGIRIGYEATQSSGKVTLKFYANTKWSVLDKNNTFIVNINGSEKFKGKVTIKTYNTSGTAWSSKNDVLLKTFEVTSAGTVTFSASLTGVELHESGVGSNLKATVSGSKTNYTAVGKGTVTITDNGNNTFSVSGTKGANGTNNTASGPTLSWGYNTDYGKSVSNPIELTIATPTNATRTVYAKGITEATYGSDATVTTSLAIKQYVAPGDPGKPVLSYSKSRLTTKENWTFTWTAAKATNTSSPVKGYRIRLYKNGVLIPIKNNSGSLLSELRSGTAADWIYDANITSLTINPVIHEFAAGDTVVLSLYAYAVNGKGTTNHWSGGGTRAVYSDTYTVQNAGIVRVKVGSEWKEGQVYIKANGAWKEAETVSTRVGGQWKEAE